MHFSVRHLSLLMAGILTMLAISSCKEDDSPLGPDPIDQPADHTLLMFLMDELTSSDALSTALQININAASLAIQDSVKNGSINLVIFKDLNNGVPECYWLHRDNRMRLDTVPLMKFNDDPNSASPEMVEQVVRTVFQKFNSSINGIVIGAHALGWTPSEFYERNGQNRVIGYDKQNPDNSTHRLEIWELRQALERSGVKFDYMIADCCNMGSAEVAYEMRNLVKYMVASPTEIEGVGMPYHNVVTRLSKCKTTADLPDALAYGMKCYFDRSKNHNGATISLYDMSKMEQLGQSFGSMIAGRPFGDKLEQMSKADASTLVKWQENLQHYGRTAPHSYYYFYDMSDVLFDLDPYNDYHCQEALNDVVIRQYSTPKYHEITVNHFSGMAISLPQLFRLQSFKAYANSFTATYANLEYAYVETLWGKKMAALQQ